VDTYVLVTGDGDFIPLVSLLRSRGKQVVVIGVSEATSYHLIESADDFISYASLLEEERAARARDKGPKKKAADPFKELVRAVETLKKGGKTRVLGQVKQQMIVQLGSFDDFELQVYLPNEKVPELPESDLASEEPKEDGARGAEESDRAAEEDAPPEARQGFDLLEDLTPYELRTITRSVSSLKQPASFVEIFGSIRELDERGELELSREEIVEVISAMLEADYLSRIRAKPYKQAKADLTFYALNREREEVKNALAGS
jgi:hypothetical protein